MGNMRFENTAGRDAVSTFSTINHRKSKSRFNRSCFFRGMAFIGKNLGALSAGFVVGMVVRASLGASNKREPSIFRASNGTELVMTDVLSCFTTLLLCQFWVKPSKTRLKETCCDPKLLLRTTLRDGIPFLIGVASLFLIKFIDVSINGPDHVVHGPNDSRLFEESDVVGGLLVLISFHIVDRLLEWKWPSDPYQSLGLGEDSDEELGIPPYSIPTENTPLF